MKKFFILILLFLNGCTVLKENEIPYVTYTIARLLEDGRQIEYQGYIDRGLDVDLSFNMSGIIDELYVREGDFVKKGEVLAKLDNEEYKLDVSRTQNKLEDAIVKYNRAKSYFERVSKLHTAGGISYNDWENAQTDLKSAKNQIEISKSELGIAKSKERFSHIYAPYDGYIIKTHKDKMQFTTLGDKVISFQGKGMAEAKIFVSQNEINKLSIGQKAILKADPIENKIYGAKIKSISKTSINEGSYRITVSVENNPKELVDGMSVYVIVDSPIKKRIMIPIDAVCTNNDEKFVYAIVENYAKKKIVETGIYENGMIEIKKGISTGEKIITGGMDKIMDGAKVEYD
ncbi:MAG: efflux RND transporter periplasmic adaptor subunit [Candidatus Gastranaerophilales bacterium]|nr:efflux RND transporter periplasmic adaptor subunit [Candidatus Gastranaerophilales bacterium]